MKFSAVIFDMDGLMLDTERIYRDVFNRAAADCDIDFPNDLHLQLLGRNTKDTMSILRGIWKNDTLFDRFIDRSRHHHSICFDAAPALKNGLLELLDFIEARKVPKIVATSTKREHAIPRLQKCGLLERFATVSTGDQVVHGKPAPDLFLLAARTIDVDPKRCVVLEDSEAGITGAHAAGMATLMVPDLKEPCAEVRAFVSGVFPSLFEARQRLEQMI